MQNIQFNKGVKAFPAWAEELRRRYLRGEVFQFILHGNINDIVLYNGAEVPVSDFLADAMLSGSKETVAFYNMSTGVRFSKRKKQMAGIDELMLYRSRDKVLPELERLLLTENRLAIILEYAEMLAPASDLSMYGDSDRSTLITLHRWSGLTAIEHSDNVIILMAENLTELAPKLVNNARIAAIKIPMPEFDERKDFIKFISPNLEPSSVERLADITAGLKMVQIRNILMPQDAEPDIEERREIIAAILGPQANADRVEALARMTKGVSGEELKEIVKMGGVIEHKTGISTDIEKIVAKQKREVIERECAGLLEFVTPKHGFEAVGGMDEVKRELMRAAKAIRDGETAFVPMGFLFVGPMGTGKTFVAEAFAKESGVTAVKFGSFRSKWVGATESNLEKILDVISAMGQVIVIIDEVDRALGGNSPESDGGTESRVIAKLKEFMSDTKHRGRILFILMTNRPDLLDTDIKRAGRIDRKIPFFYPQTGADAEVILESIVKRYKLETGDLGQNRKTIADKLAGYSNADIEGVVMLAVSLAETAGRATKPSIEDFEKAAADYLASRDVVMIEYMELLAVYEASNRSMLPPKYSALTPEELSERLALSRQRTGNRR